MVWGRTVGTRGGSTRTVIPDTSRPRESPKPGVSIIFNCQLSARHKSYNVASEVLLAISMSFS
eukprot:3182385-Amphidinium_carterae.1